MQNCIILDDLFCVKDELTSSQHLKSLTVYIHCPCALSYCILTLPIFIVTVIMHKCTCY